MHFAAVDNWLKTGEVKEFGFFLDGRSGYVIAEGDSIYSGGHSHSTPSLRARYKRWSPTRQERKS
jgi:hypothetical protein